MLCTKGTETEQIGPEHRWCGQPVIQLDSLLGHGETGVGVAEMGQGDSVEHRGQGPPHRVVVLLGNHGQLLGPLPRLLEPPPIQGEESVVMEAIGDAVGVADLPCHLEGVLDAAYALLQLPALPEKDSRGGSGHHTGVGAEAKSA